MTRVYSWVTLAAICLLAGAPFANGQVVANPYIKASAKENAPLSRAQGESPVDTKLAILALKLERVLNEMYRIQYDLAERGRIWAETKDEWTDIRIIESNLNKAASHKVAGERHWEAGRYTDWHREWTQAGDVMEKSLPQLSRTERMIRARRGR